MTNELSVHDERMAKKLEQHAREISHESVGPDGETSSSMSPAEWLDAPIDYLPRAVRKADDPDAVIREVLERLNRPPL